MTPKYVGTRLKTTGNLYKELFKRHTNNPILTASDWTYPANTVFNPAATMLDGKVLILARVEDRRGFSHLTKAVSKDGVSNWNIDTTPTFVPDPQNYPEEEWGMEDPRITWMEEEQKYAITYTAHSQRGPVVSLALTENFEEYERLGPIMAPEDKDAALFPRRFNGEYILIHRPIASNDPQNHIWTSKSENLKYWGNHHTLIYARGMGWWDANKIGLCTPPLETSKGWLILYHGVRQTAQGAIYRLGLALLDYDNPLKVLKRGDEWIFGPSEIYEREGDVGDVVFPCGWVLNKNTNEVTMYYGGADTCIAVATANLDELLEYIMSCPDGQGMKFPV